MNKELDIVIIEDIARDAEAMEAALRDEEISFKTRRIQTREEFRAVLETAPPDIVLSDFTLPEFDALEALHLLQAKRPDIPFILVTGNRSEEVAVACIKEGADDYILKASLRRLPSSVLSALRKKAVEREKAAAEAKLRELPRLILHAQEAERRRVARELHDSVNQLLSSVKFRIQSVEARLPKEDNALSAEVEKTRALLDKAMLEVRRISRNLRPSELDDLGLVAALRSLCTEFGERTGIVVELVCPDTPQKLPADIELSIYRIAQEALTNVEKHAGARRVTVELACDDGGLRFRVRDDGRGFDQSVLSLGAAKDAGMGLMDIEERVRLVGGICSVESSPGAGTQLVVELTPQTRRVTPAGRLPVLSS
ncbi:MAG: response regulator [Verrucomicrobia bacterium]|nr:response regulator [Verrucomicrobiota bacterium]